MYNCNFNSILNGRFINFSVGCFNSENDNLRFFARVASVPSEHCFCKNLNTACEDFQLLLASPLINVLCEVIYSLCGLFKIDQCHSNIEYLLHEICFTNL